MPSELSPTGYMRVKNPQCIVPRLAGAVERASAIKDDVRAPEEPERGLVLEGEREGVVRPVVEVVVELDSPWQVL